VVAQSGQSSQLAFEADSAIESRVIAWIALALFAVPNSEVCTESAVPLTAYVMPSVRFNPFGDRGPTHGPRAVHSIGPL
jgi:hypothetical protein